LCEHYRLISRSGHIERLRL